MKGTAMTYEETIKHLAELYKTAVGDKPCQPSDKPRSPYAPEGFHARGEAWKHAHNFSGFDLDFREYDRALYKATQELELDWFTLNKATLDYIHGRLTLA